MFEEESIKWATRELGNGYVDDIDNHSKTYRQGAEFGYNKANEWRYPGEGELPETSGKYLVFTGGEPFMLDYDAEAKDFGYWRFAGRDYFVGARDTIFKTVAELGEDRVIAWKEIVPPKGANKEREKAKEE